MSIPPRRHLIIPDTQVRPGVDTTHIDWAAKAIVEYKPDVIVVIGDFWDMPSLSMHDAPGSKDAEGRRVKTDLDVGNEAFARLIGPMEEEIRRGKQPKRQSKGARRRQAKADRHHALDGQKPWDPERHFFFGNHEDRLTRAVFRDPKFDGILSLDSMKTPGFVRHPFLDIVDLDGIAYSHYFPNPFSGKAIGGTIVNRLNAIGKTFVQGHQQGFLYASKQYPDHVKHGVVCGRFYQHHENYRPRAVQETEWNGILVLNQVRNGDFDLMPLRMDYLRRKYGTLPRKRAA